MIKHYFKIALRNLRRQKMLSLINILGLSVGLACFSLFLLYSVNEFSFDRFHKNAANIYEVSTWNDAFSDREAGGSPYLPMPLGKALKNDFPDVENYVRFRSGWDENFVRITDNDVRRVKISYTDPQFFSVFSFPMKYGNAVTALLDIHSIVLTQSKAEELFGNANAIGRTVQIKIDNTFQPFTVSAVAKDIPSNSTISFDALASFIFLETQTEDKKSADNWHRSGYFTYVQLRPGSSLPYENEKLINFRKKYYPDEEDMLKKQGLKWSGKSFPIRYALTAIRKIHTNTKIEGGVIANVNPRNIWILLAIAAGVLLIACINFTTLSIGRSAGRAKEVGVRKVIGGDKKGLIFQFLMEAIVLTILSALIAYGLAQLLLPYFNNLSGRKLNFSFIQFPAIGWMFAGLILFVAILAGSYPALVLSRFNPVDVLKSKIRVSGANFFTKSLVTLQFVLSVVLIISTTILLQQVKYMRNTNPGFNKENVVMIDGNQTDTKKIFPLFKQEIASNTNVLRIAATELGLGNDEGWSTTGFEYNGKHKQVFEYYVDNNYLNVMGMQLKTGRNFNPAIAADTQTSVIINEAMVRDFGWTNETAVGQLIKGYTDDGSFTPVVIGVVKDFHFRSFTEEIRPQMFQQFSNYAPYKLFVRIKPGNPAPVLAAMQTAWRKVEPELPFKYNFLDESLSNFYKEEDKWSSIIGWAGGISIFLACLGLFGLAALAAVNRTKEIGIRRVLGASVTGIVQLLSKDFIRLIVLAVVIASPLAWYFMNKALQNFAYRIDISLWVFITTGVTALLIALITICFQAIKAAIANPVKSLRTE
jgi:putative ABC transport system permease protein